MKKLVLPFISFLAVAMLFCLVTPQAQAQDKSDDMASISGEVVDMNCYITRGAKGPDHAGCAKACVKGGQPMGLLTDDGTLVLLAKNNKSADAYEGLKEKAGEKVEVSGKLAERDGIKMMIVSSSK